MATMDSGGNGRSPRGREARSHRSPVLVALVACLLAVGLSLTASAQPIASFLIEKITVEGVSRGQARIVAAESLLREGATYDERGLRDAVYRVKRLPFVLLADFSLRKGSVRGSYELVITVVATKRFFFATGGTNWWGAEPHDDPDEFGYVGFRQTVGSYGEMFVQLSGFGYTTFDGWYTSFQFGYNQYNLFGRGAVASLVYSENYPRPNGGDRSHVLQLELTVPLTGNHAARVRVEDSRGEARFSETWPGSKFEYSTAAVSLGWLYDDTDDPVSPRDGQVAEAELNYYGTNQKGTTVPYTASPGGVLVAPYKSNSSYWNVALSLNRYRPISERQSWSLSCLLGTQRTSGRDTAFADPDRPATDEVPWATHIGTTRFGAGHAFDLYPRIWTEHMSRLRLETDAAVTVFHLRSDQGSFAASDTLWYYEVRTGLVYRYPRCLVRVMLGYRSKTRVL